MANKKINNGIKKSRSHRIIIPLVGVGILLVVLAIFLNIKINKDSFNTNNFSTKDMDQKFDATSTLNNDLSEIRDWKTYNLNNVKFKYPSNWILDENNNLVFAPENEGLTLYTYNESNVGHIDKLKCKDFVESKTVNDLILQKYIATSTEVVSDECWGVGMGDFTTIFITKEGDSKSTYRAAYDYSKQQEDNAEEIFGQIISTFEFVD